jgi:hypothetical protein
VARAWDEAAADADGSSPGQLDGLIAERSLDEQLLLDEAEVKEVGVDLDDPGSPLSAAPSGDRTLNDRLRQCLDLS